MTRKAVLIEASEVEGQDPLPGALRDVANLKSWLMSSAGGAWDESEIVVLHTPTVGLVLAHINDARRASYAFVTFSGHGEHPARGEHDDTRVTLAGGTLRAAELNCGADRCTVLIDACRYVAEQAFTESFAKSVTANKYAMDSTRQAHRAAFDAQVAKTDKGVVYMYSCGITEFAGESSQSGGYYTHSLILQGEMWYSSSQVGVVYDTRVAHENAALNVTRRVPQQHPEYAAGRRMKHPPFAVRA